MWGYFLVCLKNPLPEMLSDSKCLSPLPFSFFNHSGTVCITLLHSVPHLALVPVELMYATDSQCSARPFYHKKPGREKTKPTKCIQGPKRRPFEGGRTQCTEESWGGTKRMRNCRKMCDGPSDQELH